MNKRKEQKLQETRGRKKTTQRHPFNALIDDSLEVNNIETSLSPIEALKLHYNTSSKSDVINFCISEIALKHGFLD
jgi:hypothetical protein